jgi:uncharacterized protein YegL
VAGYKGNLLPVYMIADESSSMAPWVDELNLGLASLHDALLAEPMAAAKVRFSILGFSDTVVERMRLADLRRERQLPPLRIRKDTRYREVFADLRSRIPWDVRALKEEQFAVHRPAVFFLTDGRPSDGDGWRDAHRELTDRTLNPAAPNVVACGIGQTDAATVLALATRTEFAFVSIPGIHVGGAVAKFCAALTKSVVESGRSVANGRPALVMERPQGFQMAIDVV